MARLWHELTQQDYHRLYRLVDENLNAGMGEGQEGDDSAEAWGKLRDKLAVKAGVVKPRRRPVTDADIRELDDKIQDVLKRPRL
jgi:hypothetical protein